MTADRQRKIQDDLLAMASALSWKYQYSDKSELISAAMADIGANWEKLLTLAGDDDEELSRLARNRIYWRFKDVMVTEHVLNVPYSTLRKRRLIDAEDEENYILNDFEAGRVINVSRLDVKDVAHHYREIEDPLTGEWADPTEQADFEEDGDDVSVVDFREDALYEFFEDHGLSRRERVIGRLLIQGYTMAEIAGTLKVSTATVHGDIAHMRKSLISQGVHPYITRSYGAQCTRCNETKSLDNFEVRVDRKGARIVRKMCKACKSAQVMANRNKKKIAHLF